MYPLNFLDHDGVPLFLNLGKVVFWNFRLAGRPKVEKADLWNPWDPPSRIAELEIASRFWPSAGKFWHHEVAAFSSKTLTISISSLTTPPPITRPLNIKIQSKD